MSPKQILEVVKAFDEGKEIEYRYEQLYCMRNGFDQDIWWKCEEPKWNFEQYDYRVKKTLIPLTEEEANFINRCVWIKTKAKTPNSTNFFHTDPIDYTDEEKKEYYILNEGCWEDWG